jgi:hypothetical protein
MKKWLTAADMIRCEIVTGLQAWFEQTFTMLEAAAAEDTNEVAIHIDTDEDGPDDNVDSDYDSVDTERDARRTTTMKESHIPNPKYPLLRVVSLHSRLYRYEVG